LHCGRPEFSPESKFCEYRSAARIGDAQWSRAVLNREGFFITQRETQLGGTPPASQRCRSRNRLPTRKSVEKRMILLSRECAFR